MVTLERVRANANPDLYPRRVLEGRNSALVLFAAGFHGAQDAIWINDAGMTATCVDVNHKMLGEMVLAYPMTWEYVHGDAFEYAELTERQWDVVTIDCPTSLFDRCSEELPLWCALARRAVVLGTGIGTEVDPPAGWKVTEVVPRSRFQGGVYWTVIEPC